MGFIHISNSLAIKHKKVIGRKVAPPTKKILKKIKIVEKYSLSYWYYEFYSYLQPFGIKYKKTDWPLGGATYQKKIGTQTSRKIFSIELLS